MRRMLIPVASLALLGATMPETRFVVTLPPALAADAGGRPLIFAESATANNETADAVDVGDRDEHAVSVTARDLAGFGTDRAATIDTEEIAFPHGFSALPPELYRVQAVLDRDGSYNYGGRGPGDLVSKVETVRFPLAAVPSIALDHAVPAERDQFDVRGLPPKAAEQILASRTHLHDEPVTSDLLTRFRGSAVPRRRLRRGF